LQAFEARNRYGQNSLATTLTLPGAEAQKLALKLIEAGIDLQVEDSTKALDGGNQNTNALEQAISYRCFEAVQNLVDKNQTVSDLHKRVAISQDHDTTLTHDPYIEYLSRLENADTSASINWAKFEKLQDQSLRDALKIFALLLKAKLINPLAPDERGKTLILHVAERDHTGYLQILLGKAKAKLDFNQLANLVKASQ